MEIDFMKKHNRILKNLRNKAKEINLIVLERLTKRVGRKFKILITVTLILIWMKRLEILLKV